MSIRIELVDNGALSIVLGERFDFEAVGPFRKTYESLDTVQNRQVDIDFRETRYIDSSALGMLINAKAHFDKKDVKLKLKNANEQIKKVFSISRFDKKFDIS